MEREKTESLKGCLCTSSKNQNSTSSLCISSFFYYYFSDVKMKNKEQKTKELPENVEAQEGADRRNKKKKQE